MTLQTALKTQWSGVPKDYQSALKAIQNAKCGRCVVCGSALVLPIIRPPIPQWRIHCNHCGSEIPFHAVLNREAWRKLVHSLERQRS